MLMTVGIPGCGKTTYCKKAQQTMGGVHISRDEIRFSLLKDGDNYFKKEKEVWAIFIQKIQAALDAPGVEYIYVDATHLNSASRQKVLNALTLPKENFSIKYLTFPVELGTALARNELREGRAHVPSDTIIEMYKTLTFPTNDVIIIDKEGVCKSG